MNEPQYVAQTLAWCNARRKERGEEPLERLPRGERRDGNSCPCGEATGLWVGSSYYKPYLGATHRLGDLPRPVQRFVAAFDAGRLPQYEQASS